MFVAGKMPPEMVLGTRGSSIRRASAGQSDGGLGDAEEAVDESEFLGAHAGDDVKNGAESMLLSDLPGGESLSAATLGQGQHVSVTEKEKGSIQRLQVGKLSLPFFLRKKSVFFAAASNAYSLIRALLLLV